MAILTTYFTRLTSFLDNKLCPPTKIQTAPKETKYIKLPYLGHISFTIRKQLREILKHSFPQIKINIILVNYNINSFFKMKMLLLLRAEDVMLGTLDHLHDGSNTEYLNTWVSQ